ncbi:MAG: PepSY domain-containing protein [Gammaproteobacteria bacterium]
MLKKSILFFIISAFIIMLSNIVSADDDSDQNEALRLRQQGIILPLETIISKVKLRHSGKILEAELEEKHGRYIYEIEILSDDGIVWEMKYDAKTATLLSTEKEN